MDETSKKRPGGFGAMTPEQRRACGSQGGRTAHARGTSWTFNSEEARAAGKNGGQTVWADRVRMVEVSRLGGEATSKDRAWMAEIGRRGGDAPRARLAAESAETARCEPCFDCGVPHVPGTRCFGKMVVLGPEKM